jgi:hypothetical protein
LQAEIRGDDLVAWIDGRVVWIGRLPRAARKLSGLPGIRSDNVEMDIERFSAPATVTPASDAPPRCRKDP